MGHKPLALPPKVRRFQSSVSPLLKVVGKSYVLESPISVSPSSPSVPKEKVNLGWGWRRSIENDGQVRPAGAGATVSPVGWSSDHKQPGSFLIHLKGQGKKTVGPAKKEEGAVGTKAQYTFSSLVTQVDLLYWKTSQVPKGPCCLHLQTNLVFVTGLSYLSFVTIYTRKNWDTKSEG